MSLSYVIVDVLLTRRCGELAGGRVQKRSDTAPPTLAHYISKIVLSVPLFATGTSTRGARIHE
jgi:hypothetical protein